MSNEERWLLAFNNADDPKLNFHAFFPACAHGDVLITTRNQQMVAHTQGPDSYCRVGEMQPDDALQLLLKISGADNSDETIRIANKLVTVIISIRIYFAKHNHGTFLAIWILCACYRPSWRIHTCDSVWITRVSQALLKGSRAPAERTCGQADRRLSMVGVRLLGDQLSPASPPRH